MKSIRIVGAREKEKKQKSKNRGKKQYKQDAGEKEQMSKNRIMGLNRKLGSKIRESKQKNSVRRIGASKQKQASESSRVAKLQQVRMSLEI